MDVRRYGQSARALLILMLGGGLVVANACNSNSPPSEAMLPPSMPPRPQFRRPPPTPKPEPPPDTRTQSELEQIACTDNVGGWHCGTNVKRIVKLKANAGGRPPVMNPAWAVPTVVLDPQNVTTLASNDNSGLDATHPIIRWDEMNDGRWACYGSPGDCPRTTGAMTIRFMSTELPSDTFRFNPAVESSSNIIVQCDLPAPSATGTLANVVLTTRANNAPPLVATLVPSTGAIAPQLFVVDTTANAVFWVVLSDGANVWEMSQPYAPAVLTGLHAPTAQVTVHTGDSYSAYNLITIRPETIFPTGYQVNNSMIIDRCTLGETSHTMRSGTNVDFEECNIQTYWSAMNAVVNNVPWAFNDFIGPAGMTQSGDTTQFGAPMEEFFGGAASPCGGYILGNVQVDGDFFSDTALAFSQGSIGTVYQTACSALAVIGPVFATQSNYNGGVPVVYGLGSVNVFGGGWLYYRTGAGMAAATFPLVNGIHLSNGPHYAMDTTGDPIVWHVRNVDGHNLVTCLDGTVASGNCGLGATANCLYGQGDGICNVHP